MEMDGSIRVKLHRGANQIGGVCTEICTDTTRLLFDVGSPLEDEGEQELLEIEGVTTGPMDCDGIFLTHYHGDHIGEIDYADANIPVYMEKYAKKILEVQQEHMKSLGSAVWADSVKEIEVINPGTYQVKFYKDDAIASNLPVFEMYATLNNNVEIKFNVVEGVGTFSFDSGYSNDNNEIKVSIGSLKDQFRNFEVLLNKTLDSSEVPA